MGVSPQPTTLEGLAKKAQEFNCLWYMYSNPAFTRGSGPRNHAITMADDHAQANAFTTSCSQLGGKRSKEEKDRHFREKVCFCCGKPGHMARECHLKKSQLNQGSSNRCPNSSDLHPRTNVHTHTTVIKKTSMRKNLKLKSAQPR